MRFLKHCVHFGANILAEEECASSENSAEFVGLAAKLHCLLFFCRFALPLRRRCEAFSGTQKLY